MIEEGHRSKRSLFSYHYSSRVNAYGCDIWFVVNRLDLGELLVDGGPGVVEGGGLQNYPSGTN